MKKGIFLHPEPHPSSAPRDDRSSTPHHTGWHSSAPLPLPERGLPLPPVSLVPSPGKGECAACQGEVLPMGRAFCHQRHEQDSGHLGLEAARGEPSPPQTDTWAQTSSSHLGQATSQREQPHLRASWVSPEPRGSSLPPPGCLVKRPGEQHRGAMSPGDRVGGPWWQWGLWPGSPAPPRPLPLPPPLRPHGLQSHILKAAQKTSTQRRTCLKSMKANCSVSPWNPGTGPDLANSVGKRRG